MFSFIYNPVVSFFFFFLTIINYNRYIYVISFFYVYSRWFSYFFCGFFLDFLCFFSQIIWFYWKFLLSLSFNICLKFLDSYFLLVLKKEFCQLILMGVIIEVGILICLFLCYLNLLENALISFRLSTFVIHSWLFFYLLMCKFIHG